MLIRLLVSDNPGDQDDVFLHISWAESLYNGGIFAFYADTKCNLPPLFVDILYLISYPMKKFPQYAFLFVKLPGTIADIFTSAIIYIASKKKFDGEGLLKHAPFISMAVFLFNPAIIYNSAYWGKWDDPVLALFLVLTIYNYGKYKEGVFYALSILSKLQGVILAPVLFRTNGLWKLVISFVVTSTVILLPFLPDIITLYTNIFVTTFNWYPHVTISAYNFWWLFNWHGWIKGWEYAPLDTKFYLFVTPKYCGILVYLLVSVLLNVYIRKYRYSFRSLCFASFFIYLTFFIFFTRIHERWMFWAIPFLALLVPIAGEKKYFYVYIILSTTYFLNMFVVLEKDINPFFQNPNTLIFLTITIAVINMLTYAYLLLYILRDIYHSKWKRTNNKFLGIPIPEITNN